MLINKIGYEHLTSYKNCQDYGFDNGRIKCVVDGCSEGKHTDVGVKLFCYLFSKNNSIKETFEQLTSIFTTIEDIKNYLLFTVLLVEEAEDEFIVSYCGDGYIIKQNNEDVFEYEKIDYNNTPPYYAYNYIPKENLSLYQDGVEFIQIRYSKKDYKRIGVATDGIEYILKSNLKEQFEKCLLYNKEAGLKRLINQTHNNSNLKNTIVLYTMDELINIKKTQLTNDIQSISFKDDITINI